MPCGRDRSTESGLGTPHKPLLARLPTGTRISYCEQMLHCDLTRLPDQPVHGSTEVTKRVMLKYGQVGALTQFAQATFPPGARVDAHEHADMAEIFLVEQGRGEVAIDGRVIEVGPGACVTVQPGESHALDNTGDGPLVLTYFGIRT